MYHLEIIQYLLEHRNSLHLDTLLSSPSIHESSSEEEAAILSTRWYEAFLHFFIEANNAHLTSDQMDDLLFFVREERGSLARNASSEGEERVMVRRRASDGSSLPLLGRPVNWAHTFLLNLVFQSTFFLLVSVCTLQNRSTSNDSTPVNLVIRHQVGRRVFASQHEIHILERHNQLSAHPPCSYPIIYFGIDDLEDAFEGFTVERDQVMCVELLLLKVGIVHSVSKPGDYLTAENGKDHVVLFQGAVPHGALQGAYQHKHRRALLHSDPHPASTILMRGPHGKGVSQVAIERVSSGEGGGILSSVGTRVFGRAASARGASLKCRLVFVSLPWQGIVQDMLEDAKTT